MPELRFNEIIANEQRLKQTLVASGDELWDWDLSNNQLIRINQWENVIFPQDTMFNSDRAEQHTPQRLQA